MDWFSSDWHLGHRNVRKYSERPFETIEEMDEAIVKNALSVMKKGDNFFFLGDLTFDQQIAVEFLQKVKKRKINFFWILGNHDIDHLKTADLQQYCSDITHSRVIKRYKTRIHLYHFPMAVWEKSFRNSFQLYGHLHSNSPELKELEKRITGKLLNVNVDFHDMKPWNLHQVFEYMEKQPVNWDALEAEKYYGKKLY